MSITTSKAERARVTQADDRWAAVMSRNAAADGDFVYSVRTTGVYCRPSCGARLARPENVQFHESSSAARVAGFRPCKRCHPDQVAPAHPHAATIAAVCRLIEQSDPLPSLIQMAAQAELSPYHFHRVYKALTGVTPRGYAQSQRERRVRAGLGRGEQVTEALYNAGFSSPSRFYANAGKSLGMAPSRYRAGGKAERIRHAIARCALGEILVAATDRGLCCILMGDDAQALERELCETFAEAEFIEADASFAAVVAQVLTFIEEPSAGLDLPLDVRGTAFQRRVWQALQEIPVGGTESYGDIARRIGSPKAVRAVAQACAANLLAVAIPCHRVVHANGALSGYRWGVERKRRLLDRETR